MMPSEPIDLANCVYGLVVKEGSLSYGALRAMLAVDVDGKELGEVIGELTRAGRLRWADDHEATPGQVLPRLISDIITDPELPDWALL